MKQEPFFVIWNPDCGIAPQKKFTTLKDAETAAAICVPKYNANEIYILKTVSVAREKLAPVEITRIK